ncbi:hypothetical protein ABPG73_012474 [Tetrahymena malaccensis]
MGNKSTIQQNRQELNSGRCLSPEQFLSSQVEDLTVLYLDLVLSSTLDDDSEALGIQLGKCQKLISLTLNLSGQGVTTQAALYLGNSIGNCCQLTNLRLNLQESQIDDYTVRDLTFGLGKCKNLTNLTLCLNHNNITNQGAKFIGEGLSSLKCLKYLIINLYQNKVAKQGCYILVSCLKKCIQLISLTIHNSINSQQADAKINLLSAIYRLKRLVKFYLY